QTPGERVYRALNPGCERREVWDILAPITSVKAFREVPSTMKVRCIAAASLISAALFAGLAPAQQPNQSQTAVKPPLYNTTKQKLLEGKQVFSFTQSRFDIAAYCEAAKHYDFTWFEMRSEEHTSELQSRE